MVSSSYGPRTSDTRCVSVVRYFQSFASGCPGCQSDPTRTKHSISNMEYKYEMVNYMLLDESCA